MIVRTSVRAVRCHVCPRKPTIRVLRLHGERLRRNRVRTDERLKPEIKRVHRENYGVYGVHKVWRQMNREGMGVARCTVARLMRELGIRGVRRGRKVRTTVADESAVRPADLVCRLFEAARPDQLWIADFTFVRTWGGFCHARS